MPAWAVNRSEHHAALLRSARHCLWVLTWQHPHRRKTCLPRSTPQMLEPIAQARACPVPLRHAHSPRGHTSACHTHTLVQAPQGMLLGTNRHQGISWNAWDRCGALWGCLQQAVHWCTLRALPQCTRRRPQVYSVCRSLAIHSRHETGTHWLSKGHHRHQMPLAVTLRWCAHRWATPTSICHEPLNTNCLGQLITRSASVWPTVDSHITIDPRSQTAADRAPLQRACTSAPCSQTRPRRRQPRHTKTTTRPQRRPTAQTMQRRRRPTPQAQALRVRGFPTLSPK